MMHNISESKIFHKYLPKKNFIQFTHGRCSLDSINLKSDPGKKQNLSISSTLVTEMKINKSNSLQILQLKLVIQITDAKN